MDTLLEHWRMQILGTLLAPGSTLSIAALAITLAVAMMLLANARTSERRLKLSVAMRVLAPRRLWRTASGRADLGWFAYSMLAAGLMFGWAIVATGTLASFVDRALGDASLITLPAPAAIAVATVASFMAYELAYYLDHRLKHRVPWLWAFHRVHHSAEHLSLFTVFRVHPVDTVIFYNIVAVIVGLVQGVLPHLIGQYAAPHLIGQTNIIIFLTAILITHLQHSHFWLTFGDRWGRILLGPAHHQIHHSSDPAHFDSNFGNVAALFDRLFGSFHMPAAKRPAISFGDDLDRADPHGLAAMTVLPFIDAAAVLREREQLPVTP